MGMALVEAGLITAEEERTRLREDKDSGYDNISETIIAEQTLQVATKEAAAVGSPLETDAAISTQPNPYYELRLSLQRIGQLLADVQPDSNGNVLESLRRIASILNHTSTMEHDDGHITGGQEGAAELINTLRYIDAILNAGGSGNSDYESIVAALGRVRQLVGDDTSSLPQGQLAELCGRRNDIPYEGRLIKQRVHSIACMIENPRGTMRAGVTNGRGWRSILPDDYGFIKNVLGDDGDELDCFIGRDFSANSVFIISQDDEKGNHDELKVMLNYNSEAAAERAYKESYEPDETPSHTIEKMSLSKFRCWLDEQPRC